MKKKLQEIKQKAKGNPVDATDEEEEGKQVASWGGESSAP